MGGSLASDAEKLAKPTRALFTTNFPLAVPSHVLPSCCALCCCCCCCCCMLRVRARVVARLTTDATPLLSPLWLLLLNWLFSCAPLWAGALWPSLPHTLHAAFAVGVVRRSKPCTTKMPGRCTWCTWHTHGAIYQPTHQRTRKSRNGFRNTPMAFQTLVTNYNEIEINEHESCACMEQRTFRPRLPSAPDLATTLRKADDACAIRHCSADVG